jgi:putative addiction module component (TIGR02574 family)
MDGSVDDVLRLAMSLPGEERLRVAEELLSSVAPSGSRPFDAEWMAEAKRRAARIDSGEGILSSWADVRDRARAALGGSSDG